MNDLISRAALLQEFETKHHCRNNDLWHITGIKAFIENAPAVDAKSVVHGKWIFKVKNNGGYSSSITCSACGYSHSRVTYNFCPECGADMRKRGANNV